MKTIAQVLMDPNFLILRSNNEKHYMTLSCHDDPVFRLYIPYAFVPTEILFEKSNLDIFGQPDGQLFPDPLEESDCLTSEIGRH